MVSDGDHSLLRSICEIMLLLSAAKQRPYIFVPCARTRSFVRLLVDFHQIFDRRTSWNENEVISFVATKQSPKIPPHLIRVATLPRET